MSMEAENNSITAAEKTVEKLQEKKEAASFIDFKMVTFSLADKDYAIDIMHVKEIAKAGRFTYVPNTLPFVLGVYNLRGEIIPILDLRLFFNIEVPPRSDNKLENLLILTVEDQTFGLVVDKIDKVVGVQKSSIQPPHPLFGDINIKYINGVVESNNRLYVLLDVVRIFSLNTADDTAEMAKQFKKEPVKEVPAMNSAVKEAPKAAVSAAEQAKNVDIKFIAESLKSFKNFYVTELNSSWINHRCEEWIKEKSNNNQLQNPADADKFLKDFWSHYTGEWWPKSFAENVKKALPDNSAKQLIVWNPGCGKGIETYCLACVLKERYPDAKVRIYAQDIDLLNVSNASMMSVPEKLNNDWFAPYLTKKANGEYTFKQEIKDSIMFEYHDCKNTNVLPMVDIIFARDVLSFIDEKAQKAIINDFLEKMKGNAVAILGDNEAIPASFGFGEKSVDAITAYTKD